MTLREWIHETFDEILLADGFDDAMIGHAYSPGRGEVAVYDAELCIKNLMKQGMNRDEAEEFFSFNVEGAWVGENTPVFMWRIPAEYRAGKRQRSCAPAKNG